jgi:hypothetical protein
MDMLSTMVSIGKLYRRDAMTIQVQNTIRRLVARHGYSATFVQHMGEGISLYSIGGIMYRIRGDGTIL